MSALMTTTKDNINNFKEIIDEYIRLGFTGIFFRPLNPYGEGYKNLSSIGYSIEEFVEAYKKGLDYIIDINLCGKKFIEFFTLLLLKRILTPFSTGFVDL